MPFSKNLISTDCAAYSAFPQHKKWFNKLWLSETLNYYCGPAGVHPKKSGFYVIRPIMNLYGMSVGAKKEYIEKHTKTRIEPGYFWCEWFKGNQYSVTFESFNGRWIQNSCWKGDRSFEKLYKFKRWTRYDHKIFRMPSIFEELHDVNTINVEFIDDRPIEVHLRKSPDPDCDEFIPIWEGEQEIVDKLANMGYNYTESYDNADGFLKQARLGFMIKNKGV